MTESGLGAKLFMAEEQDRPSSIDADLIELISKGVMAGILSAEANGELLKKAVRVVACGELWLDHLTIKNILAHAMSVKKSVTRQESEIAELIVRGYCNKEIARELKIAEATVKSHCNRLFRKYNVSGRLQLGAQVEGAPSLEPAARVERYVLIVAGRGKRRPSMRPRPLCPAPS